jgi:D-tyrosyl-tRNA(Tyr) deacylase
MKCVIQRIDKATLTVDGITVASINEGLAVFAGFTFGDDEQIIRKTIDKIIDLRIFPDKDNKLNLSVKDIGGGIMLIPNFTIYADASHGRRPEFVRSASSDISKPLFDYACEYLRKVHPYSGFGVFGAHMHINVNNDGPLTIIYENNN